MDTLDLYIPMDRRLALAGGQGLPNRTIGAALFADISGFTPLAEALTDRLGPQRGAEELTYQLNRVYEALIAQVHRYGGSVIGFVGDAITCWFDAHPPESSGQAGLRVTSCALSMQRAMSPFALVEVAAGVTATLTIKIGIATGPVRRFLVGDPQIQVVDALAGDTLRRMSLAEGLAQRGEVVLDTAAVTDIASDASVQEWRTHPETGERFAVVVGLTSSEAPAPWPDLPADALVESCVRPWVLPPVYERLRAGQGQYLAELRPAVSLFLKFGGLDYDHDHSAGEKLDAYIRWLQQVVTRYAGSLIQLTIGDKGSFLYAAFGAPIAHDDDAVRGVLAALELRTPPAGLGFITCTQIGLAQGQARTGAYGSNSRRSYGVIGDDAVLACRLMGVAPPGEIRCDYDVYRQTEAHIVFEGLTPVRVKGRAGLMRVYRPTGRRGRGEVGKRGIEATIVGRQAEVARLAAALDAVEAGESQVLIIEGEAGIGKSRLVGELARLVRERGLTDLLGAGQSTEQQTPYRAWRDIFTSYFELDEIADPTVRRKRVRKVVQELIPDQAQRLPLLNDVLNLGLAETELTAALDPKLRQQSLVSLLLSLLGVWASERPLILVLEDAHWLDGLSWELAVQVPRALAASTDPLLLVLVTRPLDDHSAGARHLAALQAWEDIETLSLTTLDPEETVALATARLGLPEGGLPDPVAGLVRERAGGNPFFAEELVFTLRDQGLITVEPIPQKRDSLKESGFSNRCVVNGDLAQASRALPDTVQGLILARMDRLSPTQQLTLKVASVIGRVFLLNALHAVHPVERDKSHLTDDLTTLARLDITPLETREPELTYIFRHIITQEVAYESLLYAHRRDLHRRVGGYLERTYADRLEDHYEILAHHYVQSGDQDKSWDYLVKAGDKAKERYANEAAIAYYDQALSMDVDRENVHRVHESLGEILTLVGRYNKALDHYGLAQALLEAGPPSVGRVRHMANLCCQLAEVYERRSEHDRAFEWLEKGWSYLDESEPTVEIARICMHKAGVYLRQGRIEVAVDWCQRGLRFASGIGTREGQRVVARAYYLLGYIYILQGDFARAVRLCCESVQVYQQIDDLVGQANARNNLANALFDQGDWVQASEVYHRSMAIRQEIGDVFGQGMIANNLAEIYLSRGEWSQAASLYEQSLAIWEQIGVPVSEALVLSNLAQVHIHQKNWAEARACLSRSQALFVNVGSEEHLPELVRRWAEFYLRTGELDQALAYTRRSIELAVAQGNPLEEGMSCRMLGQVHLARGEYEPAEAVLRQSLQVLTELNSEYEASKTKLSLARLAIETGLMPIDEAHEYLAQAVETFERLGAQADLAEARDLEESSRRRGQAVTLPDCVGGL